MLFVTVEDVPGSADKLAVYLFTGNQLKGLFHGDAFFDDVII